MKMKVLISKRKVISNLETNKTKMLILLMKIAISIDECMVIYPFLFSLVLMVFRLDVFSAVSFPTFQTLTPLLLLNLSRSQSSSVILHQTKIEEKVRVSSFGDFIFFRVYFLENLLVSWRERVD